MIRIGRLFALLFLVLLASCGGESPKPAASKQPAAQAVPSVLFQAHFIGSTDAAAREGGAKLKEILALPASKRLIEQTTRKLAGSAQKLIPGLPTTSPIDSSALLQPLAEDLYRSESLIRCFGTTNSNPEWTLAIRLNDERAKLWQAAAQQFVQTWNMGSITETTNAGYPGWTARRQAQPSALTMVRAGDWVVTAIGNQPLATLDDFLARIRLSKSPVAVVTTNWLEVQADLSKLAHWATNLAAWRLPTVAFGVSGRGQSLRTTGRITFDQPLLSKLPNWEVPTNSIRDPIVSFSATRGLDPWFSQASVFTQFGLNPMPSQAFLWGQSDFPYQTYLGLIVPNPTNALTQIATRIPRLVPTNAGSNTLGAILWNSNRLEIAWKGLPIIEPFLRANPTVDPHLILGGVFPVSQSRKPMPDELLKQFLNRNDLAHYSWEVTQARLAHWRALIQLPDVIQNHVLLPPEAAGQMWFESLLQPTDPAGRQALLSWPNAITEVTVRSPNQLDFVRSSPLGLNALEVVELVHWLDGETFPLPDRRPKRTLIEEYRSRKK